MQAIKDYLHAFNAVIAADVLKDIDEVSYVRFASVYREFKDIEDFKKEIKEIAGNEFKFL